MPAHLPKPRPRPPALALLSLALALSATAPFIAHAQDVTIGAPVTFIGLDDGQNRAPLKLKPSSKPKYPAVWRDINTYGYAIAFSPSQRDKDRGEIVAKVSARYSFKGNTTNKEIEISCSNGALRNWEWEGISNKSDPRQAWVAIIFNPASASDSKKNKNAAPRLLDVVPVFLPTDKISSSDRVAQADVIVGVSGEIKNVKLTSPNALASQNETAITDAVSKWKIAPARANGVATEAIINVPVLLLPDPSMKTTDRPTGTTAQSTTRTTSRSAKTPAPTTAKRHFTYVTQLIPTNEVATVYPRTAAGRSSGRTASITLEFTLDDNGRPQNPVVVFSTNKDLDAPALKVISQYRFEKPDPSKPDSLGNTYAQLSDARWQYVVIFWPPSQLESDINNSAMSTPSNRSASVPGREVFTPSLSPNRNLIIPGQMNMVPSTDSAIFPKGRNINSPILAPESVEAVAPVYPYALLKGNVTGYATARKLCLSPESAAASHRASPRSRLRGSEISLESPAVINASKKEFGLALAAALRFYNVTLARWMGDETDAMLDVAFDFNPANPELRLPEKTMQLLSDEKQRPATIISEGKLDYPLNIRKNPPRLSKSAFSSMETKGVTIIEFLVDEMGCVHLPRIIKTSVPEYAYVLMQQISMRVYDPPLQNGKPVVARAREEMNFDTMTK